MRLCIRLMVGMREQKITCGSIAANRAAHVNKAQTYDVAVIGAGVFGAWTAYTLGQRGRKVILLDAHGPANARASSGGESRIIRMGYGPDELYARWSIRALELWWNFFAERRKNYFIAPVCCGWQDREIPMLQAHWRCSRDSRWRSSSS